MVTAMKHTCPLRVATLFLSFSLLLALLSPALAADSAAPPVIAAKAAILMDADSGDLLYELNGDTPLYVAGLTVMMTALLASEAVERGEAAYADVVTASSTSHSDLSADASIQNIVPGESMSLENLMYCALVGGAADACNIIAEHVAGSLSAFVSRMNDRAAELGCTNTHFVNTHGLPSEQHYATAHDMARIAAAFTSHTELMDIANTLSREIPATNVAEPRYLTSANYLLRTDYTRYYYSYASGIKSSHTEIAGYCLASAVKASDSYVVSIVLGCQQVESDSGFFDVQSFVQTKKLFQWFFENYSLRDVVNPIEPVMEVPLTMGEGMDAVVVCAKTGLSLFLPNDLALDEHYTRSISIYSQQPGKQPLTAPVSQGQVLGEMTVTADSGQVYGPFYLVANTDVAVSRMELMKQRVKDTLSSKWFLLGCLGLVLVFGLYIAFVVRYNLVRARRRRALRESDENAVRTIPRKK